jgi:hypothetical protein
MLESVQTIFRDGCGEPVQLEAVPYEPSHYELVDLDRDRYTILAVDLRVAGRTTATVSIQWSVQTPYPAGSRCAAESRQNSGCPFGLPEASAEELSRHALSRVTVRLVTAYPRPGPRCHRTEFNSGRRGLTKSSLAR